MDDIEEEATSIRRELSALWRRYYRGRHRNCALFDALFLHYELDLGFYLHRLRYGPTAGLDQKFMLFRAIFDSRMAPYLHDTASLDRALLHLIERFDMLHAAMAEQIGAGC